MNDIGKGIAFFVVFLVVLSLGVVVMQQVFSTAQSMDTTYPTASESVLANSGSTQTLAEITAPLNSATVNNQTWLDFDGVNDYVNLSRNLDTYTEFACIVDDQDGDPTCVIPEERNECAYGKEYEKKEDCPYWVEKERFSLKISVDVWEWLEKQADK